jgi:Tol biopolymer transport system component/DNA-binding winged helix-turn-helix (wHTH) protein
MVKSDTQLYRFGNYQLDTIKRVLLCDDTPLQLPSRAFDVLLALVDHNQYVIDKDELMRMVWGDRVVEENNLTRHISTLRKVLDESPNDHRYIVTVPGRGYSFVAPVERVPGNGSQSPSPKKNGNGHRLVTEIATHTQHNPLEGPAQLALSDGIEQAATETTGLRSIQSARRRKNLVLATSFALILVAGALIAFKLITPRSKPAGVNSYRDWEIVRLTRTGGNVSPAISRDGKFVAYVNHEFGRDSIWIHQLATSTQLQLTQPEKFSCRDLLFSADGSELYFARVESSANVLALYRIPVFGGVAKKLRDDIADVVMLSHDGAHLAFSRRNDHGKTEFVQANADGIEERVLISAPVAFPAWSPDGKLIAFSAGTAESGGEKMGIREVRLSDGAQREITSRKWHHAGDKKWLPDGSGLIVSARDLKTSVKQLWFVAYPSGEARPLSSEMDNFTHVEVTADARMLVAEHSNAISDIWIAPLADVVGGKKIGVWGLDGLCLMPDGRILCSGPLSEATNDLWLMNPDGTERRQLTFDSGNDVSPAVSRDGRFIVFASNRSGNFEIWRMSLDGSDLMQLTRTSGANPASISPDSKWVVYLSSGSLHKIPIEGGEPTLICERAAGESTVSPDGKLIAYFSMGKESLGISVSSLQEGSIVKRFEGGSQSLNKNSLKWTPEGKALLYSQSRDGVANLWMQSLDGRPPKQVTDFKTDGIFRFDVSQDGKTLVCARGGWKHDIVLIKNLR